MAKVYPFRYPESKGKICFARQNLTKLLSADFILYSRNKKCTFKCLNFYPGSVAFLVPTTKSKINLVEPNLVYAMFPQTALITPGRKAILESTFRYLGGIVGISGYPKTVRIARQHPSHLRHLRLAQLSDNGCHPGCPPTAALGRALTERSVM